MAIYFASDVHLGLKYNTQDAEQIEKRFVNWLRSISSDCEKLFLVGDIFDFWFEWNRVIPMGHSRLFGELASMSDRGVEIIIFTGNHDLWQSGYFTREFNAKIYTTPQTITLQHKKLYIGHGDSVGRRPFMARALGGIFRSRPARWIFRRLVHPDLAVRFGLWWSSRSRHSRGDVTHQFRGEEEYLVKFARATEDPYDYFIFGHLHTPTIYPLNETSSLVILGEWIVNPVYARMENGTIELKPYHQ